MTAPGQGLAKETNTYNGFGTRVNVVDNGYGSGTRKYVRGGAGGGWLAGNVLPAADKDKGDVCTSKIESEADKQKLISDLIFADSFYFYGHGSSDGSLVLGIDKKSGKKIYLTPEDIAFIAAVRLALGLSPMSEVYLRACFSTSSESLIVVWLLITTALYGYSGVTAGTDWPIIRGIEKYPGKGGSISPPTSYAGSKKGTDGGRKDDKKPGKPRQKSRG